mmetsp:Transcript_11642/g.41552  ORF Transcript_11642/g.41552 Transcript_11642/m.41552 type:complete len:276 (+) Transcript_11642:7174-8001(+)
MQRNCCCWTSCCRHGWRTIWSDYTSSGRAAGRMRSTATPCCSSAWTTGARPCCHRTARTTSGAGATCASRCSRHAAAARRRDHRARAPPRPLGSQEQLHSALRPCWPCPLRMSQGLPRRHSSPAASRPPPPPPPPTARRCQHPPAPSRSLAAPQAAWDSGPTRTVAGRRPTPSPVASRISRPPAASSRGPPPLGVAAIGRCPPRGARSRCRPRRRARRRLRTRGRRPHRRTWRARGRPRPWGRSRHHPDEARRRPPDMSRSRCPHPRPGGWRRCH